ncbi:MAG TPA: flavin reductase [Candidatus Protoclostridium stercorigallinarum]|uniref:Flavin reductase n=1 Tax=Candidatus Protoclostridium stercorigallinarum TaxID=2838741 RepID=A0A9D1Q139_9FIRM|nr:flavin reductase [Candidatus Protoclostridium stercorigallinarum]
MYKVTDDILYVGVDDKKIDLFEGQYKVPKGMSYNSYVITDEKIAVMDTVDRNFGHEWLDNLEKALGGRAPDYLVVQHMEPDHSANIKNFADRYPTAKIVGNLKTFVMMKQFFGTDFEERKLEVKEGDVLDLGKHKLTFVFAPMVHWPEVMVTFDTASGTLFSADGFGKFGASDADEPWADEARRYYIGIVGKYGVQVQNLLKKAAALDIKRICPLHGPVLDSDLGYYLDLYDTWSGYRPEREGVFIAYTSVYGNTKKAVEQLENKLLAKGCPKVVVKDLARSDMSECVMNAFMYDKVVFATTTYNGEIFPFMHTFITELVERGWKDRTAAFVENGTWAPMAAKVMKKMLEPMKGITYADTTVTIRSAVNAETGEKLDALASELCRDYIARDDKLADKNDLTALFKIGYGLYVLTSGENGKDNGMIVNTVSQVTSTPNRIAVCINKDNYTHHLVKRTGIMNVNCLSEDAPFSVFERYGFASGRNKDKFEGVNVLRSDNGLVYLPEYINSFMSLKVESYVDLGTHGLFICSVTEARVMNDRPTMTYTYYHEHVKPRPKTDGVKGWVCKICGYIYEGEELPEDFVCPLCKHGASDFEKIV